MISAQRICFAWPTVESTWDDLTSETQFAPLLLWKGKLWGEIAIRVFIVLSVALWLPILLVPRPRLIGVYGYKRRALSVRWLLWEFYIGPKPPTIVVAGLPPGVTAEGGWDLSDEDLLALIKNEKNKP